MTHTKGPWSVPHFAVDGVNCDCKYILAEYGGMGSIATIDVCKSMKYEWGDDSGPDLEQAKANAHLIAAAPELLDALTALVDDEYVGNWSQYKWETARAAIAKANGG